MLFIDLGQNGLEHPAVDMSLEDGSGMLVDGFERTYDGKLKCRYCNYATRGTARLIEHIRIHTGKQLLLWCNAVVCKSSGISGQMTVKGRMCYSSVKYF